MKTVTVGAVKFTAKASVELREQLVKASEAGGVPWHEAIEVINVQLDHTARVAAQAQLVDMTMWTPAQWAAAKIRAVG